VGALCDEPGSLPNGDSHAAASDDRRRQFEDSGRTARRLGQALRPANHGLPHREHEIGSVQRPSAPRPTTIAASDAIATDFRDWRRY
jgi:hypothetical protein